MQRILASTASVHTPCILLCGSCSEVDSKREREVHGGGGGIPPKPPLPPSHPPPYRGICKRRVVGRIVRASPLYHKRIDASRKKMSFFMEVWRPEHGHGWKSTTFLTFLYGRGSGSRARPRQSVRRPSSLHGKLGGQAQLEILAVAVRPSAQPERKSELVDLRPEGIPRVGLPIVRIVV